eukprot:1159420-Pelagomonas_calceolata.AAC.12
MLWTSCVTARGWDNQASSPFVHQLCDSAFAGLDAGPARDAGPAQERLFCAAGFIYQASPHLAS